MYFYHKVNLEDVTGSMICNKHYSQWHHFYDKHRSHISQLFTPENTNWSYHENSIETTVSTQADSAKLASTTTVPQQGDTRRALDNPNFEIGLEIFLKNNYISMISASDLLNISAVNKKFRTMGIIWKYLCI